MKNIYKFLTISLMAVLLSCGTSEEQKEMEAAKENIEDINDLLEDVDPEDKAAAMKIVDEQLNDPNSALNKVMDTISNMSEEDKDRIEEKISEGLDALNKSF